MYVSITCHVLNSNGGFEQEYVRFCSLTTKNIISSPPQCLRPPDLAGRRLTIRYSHPSNRVTIWSRCLLKSRGKLNSLYIYYHIAYRHPTWHDGGLHWVASSYKLTWPLIMWTSKITWETKTIISPLPQWLLPSTWQVVTYLELLLSKRSHGLSHEVFQDHLTN